MLNIIISAIVINLTVIDTLRNRIGLTKFMLIEDRFQIHCNTYEFTKWYLLTGYMQISTITIQVNSSLIAMWLFIYLNERLVFSLKFYH